MASHENQRCMQRFRNHLGRMRVQQDLAALIKIGRLSLSPSLYRYVCLLLAICKPFDRLRSDMVRRGGGGLIRARHLQSSQSAVYMKGQVQNVFGVDES